MVWVVVEEGEEGEWWVGVVGCRWTGSKCRK
jgi:hypothetical protein